MLSDFGVQQENTWRTVPLR